MSERQSILTSLKTRGQLTAADAAHDTGLTSMGARGHLERLEQQGLVTYFEAIEGRGRPKRYWTLTPEGHKHFPQHYDRLSVDLIDNIRALFGESGLNKVIAVRQDKARTKYQAHLSEKESTEEKLYELARLRTEEGYMAELITTDLDEWELVEHHCPICAAAEECQSFCRSELNVFREALGPNLDISREEHLLAGGKRCRYRIRPKSED